MALRYAVAHRRSICMVTLLKNQLLDWETVFDFVAFVGPVPGTIKLYVMVCSCMRVCWSLDSTCAKERHDPVHRFKVSSGTVALLVCVSIGRDIGGWIDLVA